MAPYMNAEETRVSFDHIVKQIKELEGSIEATARSGFGPRNMYREAAEECRHAIELLEEAREKLEMMICWYDN